MAQLDAKGKQAMSTAIQQVERTAIAKALDARGIKSGWVARKLGVSDVTVRSWRCGMTRPSPAKGMKLVELLKPDLKLEDIYASNEG